MNHKYIRVNNKIYKVKDYFMLPLDYPKFSVYGSNETFYEAKVEGADKIEDLCDEFLVADGKYTATFNRFGLAKMIKGELFGMINGESVAKYENNEWRLL